MSTTNTVVIAIAALAAIWMLTRNRIPKPMVASGLVGKPAPSAGAIMGGLLINGGCGTTMPDGTFLPCK